MYPKLDAIRLLLRDQPFDIFTISETWLNPAITDQELLIPGYTILRQDRSRNLGGGIAVYIRDGIPYRQRDDFTEDQKIESCWIEITRPKINYLYYLQSAKFSSDKFY